MYLFLVGPPGVGKSTLAPVLAEMLAAGVVEIDREVERRTRKSNKRTIDEDGMPRFRELETKVLDGLRPTPAWIVVDTGGGTPLRPANRARMRELGLIVGLRASVARITKGIAATLEKRPTRPESAAERAKHALNDPERKAAYTDVDVTFDVEHASADAAATAIVNWLASGRGLRVDIGKEKPYPMVIRAGAVDALGAHLVERGWSGRIALVSERNAAWHLAERAKRGLEASGLDVSLSRAPERLDRLQRQIGRAHV